MAVQWNLEPKALEAKIASDWAGNWLVMRCGNNKTFPLVLALNQIGVRAWTPIWVRRRRFPRSNNFHEVMLPCLPSFVFAAEEDMGKAIMSLEQSAVPSFSLMNSYGVLARIPDAALDSLRKIADINPRKVNPIVWPSLGVAQRVISGAFQGMVGVVVGRSRNHCLMEIEGSNMKAVKIPPFLLADIEA